MNIEKTRIGLILFPKLTQLDLTGPAEVFGRMPGAEVHLLWKTLDPVSSDRGLSILPTTTFEDCPPLDVICVPGSCTVLEVQSPEVGCRDNPPAASTHIISGLPSFVPSEKRASL